MHSNKPHKVSVIIPTYNRKRYIVDAINSVLNQALPNQMKLEVIVIDDGSTDNTAQVLKPLRSKIIYKKIKHSGLPAVPRNVGLKLAKGDLIAFQDSDDIWAPDKLVSQLVIFEDNSVVLSFGATEKILTNGKKTGQIIATAGQLKSAETMSGLGNANYISTLTVMVRKSALNKVGEFNEAKSLRAVEDYELWLRVAAQYPAGLRCINKILAYYRSHHQNISTANNLQAIEKIITAQESALNNAKFAEESLKADLTNALNNSQKNWSRLKNELDPRTKPQVTVVMSVFNGGVHLHQSVESILNQSFKNFEFLIIDDGSTDSSAEIIKHYKDKRIRLIQQPNHGLVYSLNKGVCLARGELIARQDADDISLPNRLELEVDLFRKDPKLGLVGSFFTYFDELPEKPGLTISMPTKSLDIKRALYITNPIGHGTAMYRKSIFEKIGLYTNDYGPTEDFELWRRIADYWEIAIIPQALYMYRLNKSSVSHTKGKIQHANTAKIIGEQWAKPFINKSYKDIVKDGLYYQKLESPFATLAFDQYAAHQIDIGKALLERGAIKTALPNALGAIRLKPKSTYLFIRPAIRGSMKRLKMSRKRKI